MPEHQPSAGGIGILPAAGSVAAMLGVFVLDIFTPLGFGDSFLYVLPVLLVLQGGERRFVMGIASVCTVLSIFGYFLSPPSAVMFWVPVGNRTLAVLTIWVVSISFLRRRQAEDALQNARDVLELRVLERTAALRHANERMEHEIAQRRNAEDALRESAQKYRMLMDHASDAILLADAHGTLIEANRQAERLSGYRKDELRGMNFRQLHPADELERLRTGFEQLARGETPVIFIGHLLCKDGARVPVEIAGSSIRLAGQRVMQGIFRDITARVRAEQERSVMVERQRQTLVREVHHRIKNNLQGVAGLLRQHIHEHPQLRDVLEHAISQVHSMAVVYGLYGKGDSAEITLCDMVMAISGMLDGLASAPITPCLRLEVTRSIRVSQEEAVPLALILNEMVMNAIKHGGDPHAGVMLRVEGDAAAARVRVDNAGSLPPGFSFESGAGLGTGLHLVKSLLPHRGAVLEYRQEAGHVSAVLTLESPVIDALDVSALAHGPGQQG